MEFEKRIDLEKVVKGYFAAYSNHNIPAIVAYYANDVEIFDGAFGTTTSGKLNVEKEVVNVFLDIIEGLTWQHLEPTPIVATQNYLSIEWKLTGKPSTSLSAVPKDLHQSFVCQGMSLFEIDDQGLIKRHADYYNPPAFFQYL